MTGPTAIQYFTNRDGERIAYVTAGDPAAPPLVLIHGWTSFMGVWEGVISTLAKQRYVVALDLLGHGLSDKSHNASYDIDAQARRVVSLVDMLGLTTFDLMGHSMGGQTAIALAAKIVPGRVRQLIVVSGVVSGKLSTGAKVICKCYRYGRYLAFAAALPGLVRRNPITANAVYGRLWFYNMHALPESIWRGQARWALDPPAITPYWKAGEAIQVADFTESLECITADTLVIFGREDAVVPTTEMDLLSGRVARIETRLYEACGHFPMQEMQEQFLGDVQWFLKQANKA